MRRSGIAVRTGDEDTDRSTQESAPRDHETTRVIEVAPPCASNRRELLGRVTVRQGEGAPGQTVGTMIPAGA